jgi:hypothetical protein
MVTTVETCSILADLSVSDVKSPYLQVSESFLARVSHPSHFVTNHDPRQANRSDVLLASASRKA